MVETEVVCITHSTRNRAPAICSGTDGGEIAFEWKTHLVTMPVIHRFRFTKSGVIHSAPLMRLKKRRWTEDAPSAVAEPRRNESAMKVSVSAWNGSLEASLPSPLGLRPSIFCVSGSEADERA